MVPGERSDEPLLTEPTRRRGRPGAVLRTIETTVERDGGRPVLVKCSRDPAGRAAIAHEARLLGLARHPGVAELRELVEDDDQSRLVQTFISSHPLSSTPCHSPAHAAGVVAAIAETVADLHHLGVVHGRISAEHIVLDPHGHPILVGFRHAQAACFGAPATDGAAPAVDESEGPIARHRHDDVAALGRLLRDLVLVHPDTSTLIPEHRWRRSRSDAQDRRALLTLADHATADTASSRPGARRFAAAILTAVPTATLVRPADDRRSPLAGSGAPGLRDATAGTAADGRIGSTAGEGTEHPRDAGDRHDDPTTGATVGEPAPPVLGHPGRAIPPRPSRRKRRAPARGAAPRRGLPWAAGLLGVTLLAFGAASLQNGERPSLRSADGDRPASEGAPPAPAPGTDPPPRVVGPPDDHATDAPADGEPARPSPTASGSTPPVQGLPATPTAADPRPLRYQPAGIVDHDRRRFTIGMPGDDLAIGPLRCTAGEHDRVAVLRVATGELFVFDGWADPDAPRHAPVVSRVAPGSRWSPRTDRCAPLHVVEPDGRAVAVAVPPEAPA